MQAVQPDTHAIGLMRSAWGINSLWHREASNGIDAILWEHDSDAPTSLSCGLGDDHLILSLHLSGFSFAHVELDGRSRCAGALERGSWMVVDTAGHPAAETEGKFSLLHVYIPKSLLISTCATYEIDLTLPPRAVYQTGTFTDTSLSRSALSLSEIACDTSALGQLRTDHAAHDLLVELIGLLAGQADAAPKLLSPTALRRVQNFIASRLDQPITLDDLAAAAGLSKFHFLRAFKADQGKTPMAALREMRLRKAEHLLITSPANITEIALQCGFGDHGHFSTAFRSFHGQSPSSFRAKVNG
ncbi:helix-turn-helix domain-containing protein [Sulfitobacter noctilucae]|uniref:helix-turn-helix domain-containing protein n=1 Tax=Sulfitobacter noctilucae TaxID=1342302 RepID=UPI000469228F|nr:AraC family transcriptional regulator [Sulfitobacter noctilucae]